ncbi:hypothetical protein ABT034_26655 [Streptomyces sp. NPDC002773]|uniref:hypothetical protein n=1 Tax=Streptomyces sp. NPDC002773 TaxID=3154430 RepID=UPI00332DBE2E
MRHHACRARVDQVRGRPRLGRLPHGGEPVRGPGGYFGGCFQALHDCLGGTFGFTPPGTLVWRDSAVARAHLSRLLTPEGEPYDFYASVLHALAEDGMRVVEA